MRQHYSRLGLIFAVLGLIFNLVSLAFFGLEGFGPLTDALSRVASFFSAAAAGFLLLAWLKWGDE